MYVTKADRVGQDKVKLKKKNWAIDFLWRTSRLNLADDNNTLPLFSDMTHTVFLRSEFLLALEDLPSNEKHLEVHWTMSQVVFPPDVGDLLRLHGLQFWTVCDTMTQTTTKCTAPLSCETTTTMYFKKLATVNLKMIVLEEHL